MVRKKKLHKEGELMDNYIIFTHKPITPPSGYEVIDNTTSDLDHRLWSEMAGMKIVYDKVITHEQEVTNGTRNPMEHWYYFNHYRRRFDDDCYRRLYVAQPIFMQCTLAQQYDYYHNLEDLKICGEALKEKYPMLVGSFEQTLNSNMLIPYIIGVMHEGQFKDYFNFLHTVLSRTLELMNCKTYEDVMKRVTEGNYVRDNKDRNNDPEYQCRILSFLAERLATMYWKNVASQIPVFPAQLVKTEGAF